LDKALRRLGLSTDSQPAGESSNPTKWSKQSSPQDHYYELDTTKTNGIHITSTKVRRGRGGNRNSHGDAASIEDDDSQRHIVNDGSGITVREESMPPICRRPDE